MTTQQEIAATHLDLSDEELFGADTSSFAKREGELLLEFAFEGLVLVGPDCVPVEGEDALPVALAHRAPGARCFALPRSEHTFLAALDLQTGEVALGPAFVDAKLFEHPPSERPVTGSPDPATVSLATAGIDRLDARSICELPWRAGHLRLVAFEWDWRSNPVEVELEGGDPPPGPALRQVAPSRPAPPDDGSAPAAFPTYLPGAAPLDPGPATSGLVFEVARTADGILVARGALTTTAAPSHLVPGGVVIAETDGVEHPVGAVVPLTLALAPAGSPRPLRLDLAVPIYLPSPAAEGAPIVGSFAVDVQATVEPEGFRDGLPPGAYQAWAFFAGRAFGPVPFTA